MSFDLKSVKFGSSDEKPDVLFSLKNVNFGPIDDVKTNLQKAFGEKQSDYFMSKNSQTFALISGDKMLESINNQSSSEQKEISKLKNESIKICEEFNKTKNTKKFLYSIEKFQYKNFKDYNIDKDLFQFSDLFFLSIPLLILIGLLFVKKKFVTSIEKVGLQTNDVTKFNLKISQATIKTAINSFLIAVIVVLSMNSSKLNDVKQLSVSNFKYASLGRFDNIERLMRSYFNDDEFITITQLENVKFKHKQNWKGFAVEEASSFKFVYYIIIGQLFLNDVSTLFILFAIIFIFIFIRNFIKKNVSIEIV